MTSPPRTRERLRSRSGGITPWCSSGRTNSHIYIRTKFSVTEGTGRGSKGAGSNGSGWTQIDDTGAVTAWDAVPIGVTAVIVKYGERTAECKVEQGYWLFVEWDVSEDALKRIAIPMIIKHVRNGRSERPPRGNWRMRLLRRFSS